jgi:hypothetical protein
MLWLERGANYWLMRENCYCIIIVYFILNSIANFFVSNIKKHMKSEHSEHS